MMKTLLPIPNTPDPNPNPYPNPYPNPKPNPNPSPNPDPNLNVPLFLCQASSDLQLWLKANPDLEPSLNLLLYTYCCANSGVIMSTEGWPTNHDTFLAALVSLFMTIFVSLPVWVTMAYTSKVWRMTTPIIA